MLQEGWLVVEVVEERVLRLCISQDGRKDDEEGEKDYHLDRWQVENSLTGGCESQPLYQAESCRRGAAGFQTCSPLPVSFVTLLLIYRSFIKLKNHKKFTDLQQLNLLCI